MAQSTRSGSAEKVAVVASSVGTIFDLAGDLLLVAENSLASTVGGAPERAYVAPSEPAFDCCPFLTVHVPTIAEQSTAALAALASGHRTHRGSVIAVAFVVLAVRCSYEVPALPALPNMADIETVARQVQQDGWALWNGLRSAIKREEIFGLCSEVYFDGGASIVEQGGCVGWRFTIRATVPGIPFEEGS